MNEFKSALALSLAVVAGGAAAATIRVPFDVATIQGAIASAQAGDTVLVSAGTYDENIDFLGKFITVQSADGPEVTIIDGGQRDSVAIFHAGEGRGTVLKGFTLRNGSAAQNPLNGGGVYVLRASPTIEGNWITGNSACNGNGVGLSFSGALVKDNRIYGNHHNGCRGGSGGGVYIFATGPAVVVGNVIENNQADRGGGGIGMDGAGVVDVKLNIIRANTAGISGGGVAFVNNSRPKVAGNVVYGNTAQRGGGLHLSPPSGSTGGIWVNNTVADNFASVAGSELYTAGFPGDMQIVNNVISASNGSTAIYCDSGYSPKSPLFTTNDLYTTNGKLVEGTCAGVLSQGGNVSADPLFAGHGKSARIYRLQASSPAVDAGTHTSIVGKRDLGGDPRIVDGNGDLKAVIDLGAYEYTPQ
jgi:hypothetical protein